MLWGCFSAGGNGNLVAIKANTDRGKYMHIEKPVPVNQKSVSRVMFQQDHEPKHMVKLQRNGLGEKSCCVFWSG